MKALLVPLLLLALSAPALAQRSPPGPCVTTTCVRGAPGPLIGVGLASLPVLLIGGGVYWLVRRRRRAV
jgi:hypothetical protein